ncbi:HNH endonuclease family protein [Streptomyces sp. ICBB 8177]|uniref:HNH endonuclease family protein n=1 Tax=Streptomyces sp. ICBB 8177 TaxID=563922 RepID=UPI000D67A749|nr:HNH endonuclease family protein [Streptomyces sp. ICBB 8177]PWI41998.1 HNH endonuclease [Streptomyces sp. ICBB 8177]
MRGRSSSVGARRWAGVPVAVVAALALVPGCRAAGGDAAGGPAGPGPATSAAAGHATSPLADPDGTRPGLAPLTTSADRAAARALIARVTTKGRGPRTGYSREQFGYAWTDSAQGVPYAHNGCDTRDDVLRRDGQDVVFRAGSTCVVTSMTLDDPYTGKVIDWTKQHAATVQIDHVMPLSYDWQMGAARWTRAERERIANDPLNLMPVDGPANSAKGDSGPASWLPPNKAIRCAYVVRFAQVSLKYALPVTGPDKAMMLRQCGG